VALPDIGPLVRADEYWNHQIADTFAITNVPDRGWTEKIWASLAAKDGSLQVDIGLGKYINRNVVDGFAGLSRGREQWTVRASRSLKSDPDSMAVGPISYEVIEPLSLVRFVLEPNDTQPIAFDLTLTGLMPPFFEARNRYRGETNRLEQDVVRYNQAGSVSGWILLDGERHEVRDVDWFGVRDRSWGMRGDIIGHRPTDLQPVSRPTRSKGQWGPWLLRNPDGSLYYIALMTVGMFRDQISGTEFFSGQVNHPDGAQDRVVALEADFSFETRTRYLLRGAFDLSTASGATHHIEIEPLSDTGFHLRTGQYGLWNGGVHGAWRGEFHMDGEYIPDCVAILAELGQIRDRPVRVSDGQATGYGIQETWYEGAWPDFGLVDDGWEHRGAE
jgi:hypothetical protein